MSAIVRRSRGRAQVIVGGPMDGWTPDPLALMLRADCDSCRRTDIAWVPAMRLLGALRASKGEAEAREAFDGWQSIGARPDSAAWVCCCGEYGVVVV